MLVIKGWRRFPQGSGYILWTHVAAKVGFFVLPINKERKERSFVEEGSKGGQIYTNWSR